MVKMTSVIKLLFSKRPFAGLTDDAIGPFNLVASALASRFRVIV